MKHISETVTPSIDVKVFRALGDPKRVRIFEAICKTRQSVSELAERLGIPISNIAQHLRLLREAELVNTQREGHYVMYEVNRERFITVLDVAARLIEKNA